MVILNDMVMKKSNKRMRRSEENLITRVYRPFTEQITKVLVKTSITANQVTAIGVFISIVAGFFLALGEWKYLLIGAIGTQLVLISDLVDGQVARYKNLITPFGGWWDPIANKIFKYFLFFGAIIGVYRVSGDPLILIIGTMAIFNVTMIAFVSNFRNFYDFSKEYHELPRINKKFDIPFGLLTVFALSIFALLNIVSLYLWFFAIFGTIAWMKQVYSHYKLAKNYKPKN